MREAARAPVRGDAGPEEAEADPTLKTILKQATPEVYWAGCGHEIMWNAKYLKDTRYYRIITDIRWQGKEQPFCTGVAVVTGHSPPAFISLRKPGECVLRYSLPGRVSLSKRLTVGRDGAEAVLGE